jgi:hypothetical protein
MENKIETLEDLHTNPETSRLVLNVGPNNLSYKKMDIDVNQYLRHLSMYWKKLAKV